MRALLRGLVAGCAAAVLLAAVAAADGVVRERPIIISQHRLELIAEYSRIHYGEARTQIVPLAIVIHWTASASSASTYAYFCPEETGDPDLRSGGALNVAAHFLIDRDGTIYQLTPDNLLNRHAIGLNWCAIGIENVGGVDGREDLTEAQLAADAAVIRHLVGKYPSVTYLFGHYQQAAAKATGLWRENVPGYEAEKSDPGPLFMARLQAAVADLPLRVFPPAP